MNKIKKLGEIIKITKKLKEQKMKVGLITGCFDVLHMGHLNTFSFAKRNVDILIIGVDSDESVQRTKGKNRPINKLKDRLTFLSELESVDYVFSIRQSFDFGSNEAISVLLCLTRKISPTHLITHGKCDRYWKDKKQIAGELGIDFVLDRSKKVNSSSSIIKKVIEI